MLKAARLWIPFFLAVLLTQAIFTTTPEAHKSPSPPASQAPLIPTPSSTTASANKILIVRAYYSDPKLVDEMASWLEPWEVHARQGYLVVGVNQVEYDRLLKMGFRLEIDQLLTDQANQTIQRLPEQTAGIPGFPCYRTVAETYASAQALTLAYSQLATWIDVGDSWEKTASGGSNGSDLMVLRLTNANLSGSKPRLFITASIHAREYAPAELATRFAEYLLKNYNTDPDITWLLDYHEIHLLLQANPDGRKLAETRANYDYIWWRKNTNQNYCQYYQSSRGADLNRNFAFQWSAPGGASQFECDDTYRGILPASEPETQAIQAYDRLLFPDQRGTQASDAAPITATGVFIDLHSYGDLILWPWGYTDNRAPNDLQLGWLGQKFAYFNQYEPEQSINLYPTSGTTDDYAYGILGAAAYTFEVGADSIGFFPSCNYFENTILPDNLPALLYAAKAARFPYQSAAGPDVTDVLILPNMVLSAGESVQLTAQADDARYFTGDGLAQAPVINNIAAVEYYIDGQPWQANTNPISNTLSAMDGNFDHPHEAVLATIATDALESGRHTLYLRARDSGGNWGPFSAAFLYFYPPSIFLPAITK